MDLGHWDWDLVTGNGKTNGEMLMGQLTFKDVQSRLSQIPWFEERQKTIRSTYFTRNITKFLFFSSSCEINERWTSDNTTLEN